jgi:hypothetical protein
VAKQKKPAKRKAGRPPRLDHKATRERFLRNLSKWGSRRRACKLADISYSTLTAHMARDPVFAAEVEDIEQEALDDIEGNVLVTAKTDASIGIRVLKIKRPKEWGEKQIVSHEGSVTVRVIEDESWYNNRAHDKAAQALTAPVASIVESLPLQAGSLRSEVGQNCNGAADGH